MFLDLMPTYCLYLVYTAFLGRINTENVKMESRLMICTLSFKTKPLCRNSMISCYDCRLHIDYHTVILLKVVWLTSICITCLYGEMYTHVLICIGTHRQKQTCMNIFLIFRCTDGHYYKDLYNQQSLFCYCRQHFFFWLD